MAILLGADPSWYAQEERRRALALSSVMEALNGYQERERQKRDLALSFMSKSPGAASGPMGQTFMDTFGDDPTYRSMVEQMRREDALRSSFFSGAEQAKEAHENLGGAVRQAGNVMDIGATTGPGVGGGIAGALAGFWDRAANAAAPVYSEGSRQYLTEDPTGFQQAFSATPAGDRYSLATELQQVNVPMTRLVPDATPDPMERLLALGEISPEAFKVAQEAKSGLIARPGELAEIEARSAASEQARRTLAGEAATERAAAAKTAHGYRLEEIAARDKNKKTGTKEPTPSAQRATRNDAISKFATDLDALSGDAKDLRSKSAFTVDSTQSKAIAQKVVDLAAKGITHTPQQIEAAFAKALAAVKAKEPKLNPVQARDKAYRLLIQALDEKNSAG